MIDELIEEEQSGPVRVVRLRVPGGVSKSLFGLGVETRSCKVVFRHMLPAPAEATLHEVMPHGLSIHIDDPAPAEGEPKGLLVPWGQIAYITHT